MTVSLYFSDHFGVPRRVIERYGAFDISLVGDLPLFVDPFLLFHSRKPEYRKLHEAIIDYLLFLRDRASASESDTEPPLDLYAFPEVCQTWLGFSRRGNKGAGLGMGFATALHRNLGGVLRNFGDESITKGAHLEKLCLIEKGVGRDKISDFTTRLILNYLCKFTHEFAVKHLPRRHRKRVAVARAVFDKRLGQWMSKSFTLPFRDGDYVLLTPRDLLTRDENWISHKGLRDDFERVIHEIPIAKDGGSLRAAIDRYFRSRLPRRRSRQHSEKARHAAIDATLLEYPVIIDHYIRFKEDSGREAVRLSQVRRDYSQHFFLEQAKKLAHGLEMEGFYGVPRGTYDEARRRIDYLKHQIEQRGGYRLFYDRSGCPISRESDVHTMFDLVWIDAGVDVNREANNGRGPADFTLSRGAQDKVVVEFKLAANPKLKQNLARQGATYRNSSRAQAAISVVLVFTKADQERVARVLRDLPPNERDAVVVIDARADNKPAGSRA